MLGIGEIYRRLPHRYPMLMVDRIEEMVPYERAVGIKCVTVNEPHFLGHYPERPIMPGVLIIEAIAQVGGLTLIGEDMSDQEDSGKLPLLAAVNKAKFRRPVVPGDQLRIETNVIRFRSGIGKIAGRATVDDVVAAEAELLFSLVDADRYEL